MLTVEAYMPTAPVGSPVALLSARSQASAKQVPDWNCPLTQATEMMKGSLLSLVSASTWLLLNPVVDQDVMLPWPQ
jgi:hypothetical protein